MFTFSDPRNAGLDANYKRLVEWFWGECEGSTFCSGSVSRWDQLIGTNSECPPGPNYLQKLLVTINCKSNDINITIRR